MNEHHAAHSHRRVLANAREVHGELLQALDDEIEATRHRRRWQSVPIGSGVRLADRIGGVLYEFPRPRSGGLKPGASIGFQAGEFTLQVHVLKSTKHRLVLVFDEDLGPGIPAGHLILDNLWLLTDLRSRIAMLQRLASAGSSNAGRFRFDTAVRSAGLGDLTISDAVSCHLADPLVELNDRQKEAVGLVHRARAVYIWGPPGTGKTVTLSELVRLMARSKRVLIACPTNLAVDGLLERIVASMRADGSWKEEAVVRLGPADGITLDEPLRAAVSLDRLVARRLEPSESPHPYDRDLHRRISRSIVDRCTVLATTVHQAYLSPLLIDSTWDVLVADEASMISPAALYAAAGLARQYVVAGDFRQLPPVVLASSSKARIWLRRDPFEVVGIPEDVDRGDLPDHLVMLREQYRMAPEICDLVTDAYAGRLVTHRSVMRRPTGPLGPNPVQFVDTGILEASVEIDTDRSRSNPTHANLIADLLEDLLARQSVDPQQLRQVLVITPFVSQARLLDETLALRFGRQRPRVRTVHRCQGREADLVIFDLVDAANEPVSGFLSSNDFTSDGARLQTVAVTRARNQLLVIADMQYLLYSGAAGSVTRTLLRRIAAVGNAITEVPLRRHRRAA